MVLLHVVEELRGVVACRVIFPDIGTFNGLCCCSHLTHHAPDSSVVTKRTTLFGMNQRKDRPDGMSDESEHSPKKRLRKLFHRNEVLLITDKKRTPMQDMRHRRRIYNVIQALRIPLLILAGVSWVMWHAWVLAIIIFIISIPLPWVAVVIANGHGSPRDPREKNVYKPGLVREMNERAQLEAQQAQQLENRSTEVDIRRTFDGIIIDAQEEKDTNDND